MKSILKLTILAAVSASLMSCASDPPPEVHNHYYPTRTVRPTTTYTKSASVSTGGYSKTPENFEAVTPPHSYSN
ncbi:hypothetical protein [Verrucomicrobium sp. BvORR106]|uniref:hypothetical protein n=1 Tax=Verrucomicrobium sp. BvORR106 TaxID=1403819 RepID=UPI000570DC21|nr:hypothetical protein [Verrucomicrobium sp. BvORR106]